MSAEPAARRFVYPTIETEGWVARALGDPNLFAVGLTDGKRRAALVRARIVALGWGDGVAGTRPDGRRQTWSELFQSLYGEPL
jgi:hypothetical protein